MKVGGPVEEVRGCLRIYGDPLEPAYITQLLGCEPTFAAKKGQVIAAKSGRMRTQRTGIWLLRSKFSENTDLEVQIEAMLDAVTRDLEVWTQITCEFKADIYCGILINDTNRGFTLSPKIMKNLVERDISLDFDLYCS